MIHPFMTILKDDLEIVFSDLAHNELGQAYTHVYFERPNKYIEHKSGFDSMDCLVPGCEFQNIIGFTPIEVKKYQQMIKKMSNIILRRAKIEAKKKSDHAYNL